MSLGSPKLARREQAIEATRRRLRRLEIEAHRIKAELARLEAEYEDDVADWLSRKLRRRAVAGVSDHGNNERTDAPPSIAASAAGAPILRLASPSRSDAPHRRRRGSVTAAGVSNPGYGAPQIVVDSDAQEARTRRPRRARGVVAYRKTAPPLVLSFALHGIALLLCVSFTFATLVQQGPTLLAMPASLHEDMAEELHEVQIETTRFDDRELQNAVYHSEEFNIADNLLREFEPAELGAGAQPLGDIGQLDALPSDMSALMAGAGEPGSGAAGGPLGAALFFGARAQGDRFVFIVDNSRSMKDGRFDAAMVELINTIDALSPRQAFYVIFVSDKTYPMFYPQPERDLLLATAANKKRLAEWLPRAILASGDNRQFIKAMDMAAALQPHAVFLLWDGDLKYSDKVRQEVMTHLTRPNQWNFTIHTLGMGVTSLDAEYNLTAIAQAHGGTYQRVNVPPARPR